MASFRKCPGHPRGHRSRLTTRRRPYMNLARYVVATAGFVLMWGCSAVPPSDSPESADQATPSSPDVAELLRRRLVQVPGLRPNGVIGVSALSANGVPVLDFYLDGGTVAICFEKRVHMFGGDRRRGDRGTLGRHRFESDKPGGGHAHRRSDRGSDARADNRRRLLDECRTREHTTNVAVRGVRVDAAATQSGWSEADAGDTGGTRRSRRGDRVIHAACDASERIPSGGPIARSLWCGVVAAI